MKAIIVILATLLAFYLLIKIDNYFEDNPWIHYLCLLLKIAIAIFLIKYFLAFFVILCFLCVLILGNKWNKL